MSVDEALLTDDDGPQFAGLRNLVVKICVPSLAFDERRRIFLSLTSQLSEVNPAAPCIIYKDVPDLCQNLHECRAHKNL